MSPIYVIGIRFVLVVWECVLCFFFFFNCFFFFQAEDGIRDVAVTGVQTCALPISQAALDKARAQLETATAQLKRSEALYRSQSISETEYESSNLAHATASAAVVNAEAGLQTARDAMEDTQVRAPITGSILELDAVLRTVISSPT